MSHSFPLYRLAWGGAQAHELLARLVSLKYPGFPNKIQSYQATVRPPPNFTLGHRSTEVDVDLPRLPQFMTRESCYFADNFQEEMRSLSDPKKLSEKTLVMQFPFTAPVRLLPAFPKTPLHESLTCSSF